MTVILQYLVWKLALYQIFVKYFTSKGQIYIYTRITLSQPGGSGCYMYGTRTYLQSKGFPLYLLNFPIYKTHVFLGNFLGNITITSLSRLQTTYHKKSDLVAVTWQIYSLQKVSSFCAFCEFYIPFKFFPYFLRSFSWISQCSGNCQTGSVKFSWANIWRGGCGLVWTSLLPQYIYNSEANSFLLQEKILL